jgi:hypothetical protein
MIGFSPEVVPGGEMASVKEVKSGKSQRQNTPLSKQCLRYDDQTAKKKAEAKEHGELNYIELPPVLHGADCAEQKPGSSRKKGRAA